MFSKSIKKVFDHTKSFSIIFCKSFDTGVVPVIWLKANVCPLFKKGCKFKPSNYRTTALTSVYCKLMERNIRDEIMNFLSANNLIIKQQHGFVTSAFAEVLILLPRLLPKY